MFKFKKAQLGIIEMKFFLIGFIIGIVVGLALAVLNKQGVLNVPFL